MTYKQKLGLAYGISVAFIVASIALWTSVVALYEPRAQAEVLQWSMTGSVQSVGQHAAAPSRPLDDVSDTTSPNDNLQAKLLPAPSEGPTSNKPQKPRDMRKWELQYAYRLSIPSLDVRAPVLLPSRTYWNTHRWSLLEEQMQIGLSHGAVAYPHSTPPRENGTLIIAGHSSPPDKRAENSDYGSLFARLPELEIGDEITVTQNGKPTIFAVQSKEVVPPTATNILRQQHDDTILKLITCFPIGSTKDRLIITARRVGLRNM